MGSYLDDIAKEFTTHTMASLVKNPFVPDVDVPDYRGRTDIVPTEQRQVLVTEGKRVLTNVIVEPIPSNYGRVIYNGSTIRIV